MQDGVEKVAGGARMEVVQHVHESVNARPGEMAKDGARELVQRGGVGAVTQSFKEL